MIGDRRRTARLHERSDRGLLGRGEERVGLGQHQRVEVRQVGGRRAAVGRGWSPKAASSGCSRRSSAGPHPGRKGCGSSRSPPTARSPGPAQVGLAGGDDPVGVARRLRVGVVEQDAVRVTSSSKSSHKPPGRPHPRRAVRTRPQPWSVCWRDLEEIGLLQTSMRGGERRCGRQVCTRTTVVGRLPRDRFLNDNGRNATEQEPAGADAGRPESGTDCLRPQGNALTAGGPEARKRGGHGNYPASSAPFLHRHHHRRAGPASSCRGAAHRRPGGLVGIVAAFIGWGSPPRSAWRTRRASTGSSGSFRSDSRRWASRRSTR